jgi:hypothetical protein
LGDDASSCHESVLGRSKSLFGKVHALLATHLSIRRIVAR